VDSNDALTYTGFVISAVMLIAAIIVAKPLYDSFTEDNFLEIGGNQLTWDCLK